MRLNHFDLNLLVVFETVYNEGNLTRAAEKLNVAQPTISNAMTRLRDAFEDPLFVRAGRGVAPTPLARDLIEPVRASLKQVRMAMEGTIKFDPATSDRIFNISMSEIPAILFLPSLIEEIRNEGPKLIIRAFQVDRRAVKDQLASGHLDLAIDIPRLSTSELNQYPLPGESYVCVLKKNHPASRGSMTLEKMLTLDFVAVSNRKSGSSVVELALGRQGIRVTPVMRMPYYMPALRIVEKTDLALIAPRSLAADFKVIVREIPVPVDVGRTIYWHRSVDTDPANIWLRSKIISLSKV